MAQPIAFAFDDSPLQMTVQALMKKLTVKDELHTMKPCDSVEGDDALDRFVSFKKPGQGEGLKELAHFLREEGLNLDKRFVKHIIGNFRASEVYHLGDLRIIVATDVLDSTLLRLNFFLREEALWAMLMSAGVTQGPFKLGRDGLSYVGLCFAYRHLDPTSELYLYISSWISYAMAFAEDAYLHELGSLVTLTSDEFRGELWDYVISKKEESGRNRIAHVFSSCLEQQKSSHKIRYLTNRPDRDMSKERQEKLLRQLDDLKDCPEIFGEQRRAFALQVQFLKTSLIHNWTPSRAVGPPVRLRHEDLPLRPPGT